eukprot:CAMPEP_0196658802 /NCGR_PEP_ID=MMETSP1086-20130531/31669_1 /TAXON_ID=77921 /ORGANISM="Cyanoptyche  gloeocystis , Strain SAG4.97" /LENGTH=165 /DNA_ID=CAMNT_0041992545 /DNA_START=356 /DNA_END=853 /DNA_ORIENTATION=-
MRHAKTEPRVYPRKGRDFGRDLVVRGKMEAESVGNQLAALNFLPQYAVISNSSRTRQTWQYAASQFPNGQGVMVDYTSDLYHCNTDGFVAALRKYAGGFCSGTVMAVGHKPSVNDVAFWLSGSKIIFGTADAVVLEHLDSVNWADAFAAPNKFRVVQVLKPNTKH